MGFFPHEESSDEEAPMPSSSNGSTAVGPVCSNYGRGRFCNGSNCQSCWDALHADLVTPPAKRSFMDGETDAMSAPKKSKTEVKTEVDDDDAVEDSQVSWFVLIKWVVIGMSASGFTG